MANKDIKKIKEDQLPAVQTTARGIHFSPKFIGILAEEIAKTVARTLPKRSKSKKKKENKRIF